MRPSVLLPRLPSRPATTLAELLVIVALIALISGFVLPPFKRGFDRLQTRAAAQEAMTAFFTARAAAVASGRRTAVVFDRARPRVLVISAGDTLMVRDVGAGRGVTMTASRDSMAYFPDGLGLGSANLSVIFRRGAAADTVIASREGRIKLGTKAR
jgi:type II secretory pathway pseudopilin PulG